jgi:methyl-accepting chemotaxis protein
MEAISGNEFVWTSNMKDLDGNPAVLAFYPLEGNLADILGWIIIMDQDLAEVQAPVLNATWQNLLIALLVGGALIVIGFLISKTISGPILKIAKLAERLAIGDASLDSQEQAEFEKISTRYDELGIVGRAFKAITSYYQDISVVARQIASGDLTVSVQPKSAKDELGQAFTQMVSGLRQSVGQITQSAVDLAEASEQLSSIANQAGGATNQIAGTIQQIAHGTSQEAESINHTASSVEELSRAIEGVAQGAQEQAAAISKTSMITSQISNAIEQVAGNAESVVRESNNAAEAAKQGTQIVDETLTGMQAIKSRVDLSGQKVQEMGKRSIQIGEIVTTIEDIASQTNLLALNAAIEAARAGESGKGFAVVADEVRKLAERSASATREIGDLVKGIQKTVSEAVTAMEEGAREVDAGVQKANSAGSALTTILSAAEAVTQEAIQAANAAKLMSTSANELVSAVDTVSAVVEENTAATEEMAASSSEVTRAIENIASISQESSASVEEVSASAEEMSAQVQQVNSSAQELAHLAKKLQDIVKKFQLE